MAEKNLAILITAKNLAGRVLSGVKGDINGIEGAARRAGSNMGRNLAVGAAAVGGVLAVNVKAGVDSLVELERVTNLTDAALESTRGVAGVTAGEIRGLAEEYEHLTGVDDKVIQNAENILLTFTNVRKDAFEPTVEAALNLNAALGGDDESLQGVLLQVAKAMNDPTRGMTALRRSGVSFTTEQMKQVKVLQESGDLMGAQAIILSELETQFGGAAEAANQGAGRAQKRWTDAVEDIQMSLATGFLPLIERVSGKMSELVADPAFLAGVQGFGEAIASGFDEAIDFAESVDWGAVGSALSTMGSGARMAMDAFLSAPPWLQTAILTGWGLNKLTGGGLGSIVGALGSGLIKGVLGMNAGVVNIKAGVVTGGGGGGMPGPGGAGGGIGGGLRNGILTVGGVAVAVGANQVQQGNIDLGLGTEGNQAAGAAGTIAGGALSGAAIGDQLGGLPGRIAGAIVGGLAGTTVATVTQVTNFETMRSEQRARLGGILDEMPRTPAKIDESIERIQAQIDMERPFLDGILFNTNVRPQLEAEVRELQALKAAQARTTAAARDAIPWAQRNRDAVVNAAAQARASAAATTGRLAVIEGVSRESIGVQRGILAKRASVNVSVFTNVSVAMQEWRRAYVSAAKATSNTTLVSPN